MKIDIQARDYTLTPALAEAVHRATQGLEVLLGDRATHIQVRLFDINGDKGGIDKVCLVTAQTGRYPRMWVVSIRHADLYHAIALAFGKLRRMVAAEGPRERSLRRRHHASVQAHVAGNS